MYYAALSCSLAGLSAIVCVYICPYAAGSGVPELIGILNGVVVRAGSEIALHYSAIYKNLSSFYKFPNIFQVRNVLSFRTLIFKIISCLLTVLSALPVGFEGPMVHIGAMVAATLARPANPHCPCTSRNKPGKIPLRVPPKNLLNRPERKQNCKGCSQVCRYRDCKER